MLYLCNSLELFRCLWPDGLERCGAAAGEVAVRVGGVLPHPVPEPADQVWKAAAQTPLPPHSLRLRHRAALLRQARRQDPHRDLDTGHAHLRQLLPVAKHEHAWLQHVSCEPQ